MARARVTLEQILEEADTTKRVFTRLGIAYLLKFRCEMPNQRQSWCQRWRKVLTYLRRHFSTEYSKLIKFDHNTVAIIWIRSNRWLVSERIKNEQFDCFAKLFME